MFRGPAAYFREASHSPQLILTAVLMVETPVSSWHVQSMQHHRQAAPAQKAYSRVVTVLRWLGHTKMGPDIARLGTVIPFHAVTVLYRTQ